MVMRCAGRARVQTCASAGCCQCKRNLSCVNAYELTLYSLLKSFLQPGASYPGQSLHAIQHLVLPCTHPPLPIQARLDEESAALAKRQQNYQRDRDQMTAEEEEEYEHAVEESMFR